MFYRKFAKSAKKQWKNPRRNLLGDLCALGGELYFLFDPKEYGSDLRGNRLVWFVDLVGSSPGGPDARAVVGVPAI